MLQRGLTYSMNLVKKIDRHCGSLHIFLTIHKKPRHSLQGFTTERKGTESVITSVSLVSSFVLFSFVLSSFS